MVDYSREEKIVLVQSALPKPKNTAISYNDICSKKWRQQQNKRRRKWSKKVRSIIAELSNNKCVYCGTEEGPFHLDHKIPLIKGGLDELSNLVWSCAKCNLSKGSKII